MNFEEIFNPGPVEPSADIRSVVGNLWQWYSAMTSAGFDEDQAMDLLSAYWDKMLQEASSGF